MAISSQLVFSPNHDWAFARRWAPRCNGCARTKISRVGAIKTRVSNRLPDRTRATAPCLTLQIAILGNDSGLQKAMIWSPTSAILIDSESYSPAGVLGSVPARERAHSGGCEKATRSVSKTTLVRTGGSRFEPNAVKPPFNLPGPTVIADVQAKHPGLPGLPMYWHAPCKNRTHNELKRTERSFR